jgi:hypothetical protein
MKSTTVEQADSQHSWRLNLSQMHHANASIDGPESQLGVKNGPQATSALRPLYPQSRTSRDRSCGHPLEIFPYSRAPFATPVKATSLRRPTADLDRRDRRARVYASAPGGMQPPSHQGE